VVSVWLEFCTSYISTTSIILGVLASVGWREAWRPSSKVDPGAFSGQRQAWKTPKRTLWQCTASVWFLCFYVFPLALTRYSLFVLKVSLNTNRQNQTSIILGYDKNANGDILVPAYPGCTEKWPLTKCHCVVNSCCNWCCTTMLLCGHKHIPAVVLTLGKPGRSHWATGDVLYCRSQRSLARERTRWRTCSAVPFLCMECRSSCLKRLVSSCIVSYTYFPSDI